MPAAPSSTRTRAAAATREAILDSAEGVFVAKGFADASLSEIAEGAAVTKSLIHHHFGSKEGLWTAVKARVFAAYADGQRRMLEESEGDTVLLRRSVESYFRFLQQRPEFVRLLAWVQLEEPQDQPFEPSRLLVELGTEKIREAQRAGRLRQDVEPFFVLVSFLGLVEHWFQAKTHLCNCFPPASPARDDERYLEDMLKIFFEGVRGDAEG